jgi:hypothetical protein
MKAVLATVLLCCTVGIAHADDVAFQKVKLADGKGKQADARLIFSDSTRSIIVRVADRDLVTIPYDHVDRVSYEYTKKHRIAQGAIVMIASLGAGAVVMLTKSKSHWLYIDYHQTADPASIVLRMDKKNYKRILETAEAQTGKQVQYLGDQKQKKQKHQKDDNKEEQTAALKNAGQR